MDNGNGKFWKTFAVIFSIILIPLIFGSYVFTSASNVKIVEAVVTNDRLRQSEDKDIANKLQDKVDTINKDVACKLEKLQEDINSIKVSMAKLTK